MVLVSKLLVLIIACYYCTVGIAAVRFLDFGMAFGDSQITQDTDSVELTLERPIIYYGEPYTSVFVNMNGYISFGRNQQFLSNQRLTHVDSPVLAPFWSDIDTTSTGTVHYRMSKNQTELRTIGWYVRRFFFDSSRFSPSNLLVVTWDQVGYYHNGTKQNTFQVVVATDGNLSYAAFLYDDIQWFQYDYGSGSGRGSGSSSNGSSSESGTSGRGSGSNSGSSMSGSGMSGTGSSGSGNESETGSGLFYKSETKSNAQAGLVNGSDFYTLPGSGTENITLLNVTSNVGQQGSWFFRLHSFLPASLCTSGSVRLNIGSDYDYAYGLLDYEDFYYSDEGAGRLTRGRIEVCYSGVWGTVCDDDQWDNKDASVLCAQLQFSPYGAIALHGSQFSEPNNPILVGALNCSGTETNILNCSFMHLPTTCVGGRDASILCQESSTLVGNCSDGDLRLQGGENITLGRVEVCINNAWGTICNSKFGTNEAKVICRQLGFSDTEVEAFRFANRFFNSSSGPIFIENLACDGMEAAILDCPQNILGQHQCDHTLDAGVQCYDINQCVVNNGGCEQICENLVPGYECRCNRGFSLNDDGFSCADSSVCIDGDVRLVNGSNPMEGRVEVCYNNSYHSVCDDFWDELEARVVCRQLGFSPPQVPVKNAFFGQGTGAILLDDLSCTGNEQTLLNCTNRNSMALLVSDCDHSEDAGVKCQAMCMDGDVRLVVSDEANTFYMGLYSYDDMYYDKDGLRVGRVEICVGGRYGTICFDSWENNEASVVCHQLGFSPYGAIAVNADSFSEGNADVLFTDIDCSGAEISITECNSSTFDGVSCTTSGVVCQDITTTNGMCVTGEVRLEAAYDNTSANSREGRLELCINNAWGTVCDSLFDGEDAAVACSGISGRGFSSLGAEVLPRGTLTNRTGPIFLSDLNCEGSELSLLDCRRQNNQPTGLQSCTHVQDVSIRCLDINECENSNGGCQQQCINTIGSFNCNCTEGFSLNGDLVNCDDINECSEGTHTCDMNAECTNTIGSFNCTCHPGYRGDGLSCLNINECNESVSVCHVNADCMDIDGSFDCMCQMGFSGDGFNNCSDIDECIEDTDGCNETTSTCNNRIGHFVCSCLDGFTASSNNQECKSINECADPMLNICHLNSSCTDTFGSYICTCNPGFVGDGINCSNINECSSGLTNDCDANAHCIDKIGSFQCVCNNGFAGNGTFCDDIDECLSNIPPCSPNGGCYNTMGSYSCSCNSGYTGNGTHCIDVDECSLDGTCINADCFNENGNFSCGVCYPGFSRNDGDSATSPCSCSDGNIRLMNGSVNTTSFGRVEVCYNNSYGSVCNDRWDVRDASVVCRQLNLEFSNAVPIRAGDFFGQSSVSIFLDDVVCRGNEIDLLQCLHNGIYQHDCDLQDTAGVVCETICSDGDVRLVTSAGNDRYKDFYFGEAQICHGGVFGGICDDSWDNQDASVICNQLGFSRYGAIGGIGGAETAFTVLSDVNCIGNESTILECPSLTSSICVSQEIATVICQDIEITPAICNDGDVRLVNGTTVLEGRVEVCFNNVWGTVCDNRFNSDDAQVICNQLSLPFSSSAALTGAIFGPGDGPIFIESLTCVGSETSIMDCTEVSLKRGTCSHDRDVSVRCTDIDECSINNGNCSHLCVNDIPFYHCECGYGGVLDPTNLTCVFNAYCTGQADRFTCQCLPGYQNVSLGLNCTDIDECADNSHTCMENFRCVNTDGGYVCVCSDGFYPSSDNSTCTCRNGDLRLVNGTTLLQGRVEMCWNNTFGTICDDKWDLLDATVVCRQLGFSTLGAQPLKRAFFGQGTGDILIDNLICDGSENRLQECQFTSVHNCDHSEDAGVICGSSCIEGDVRLLVGEGNEYYLGGTMYSEYIYDKTDSDLRSGRVEVCIGGRYGTVCDDFWDNQDAAVVCRQIGYSPYGAVPLTDGAFVEEHAPISLHDVHCNGSELSLLSCPYNNLIPTNCGPLEDAGVVCQSISTITGDCEHGDVRLMDGLVDNQTLTMDGRLEICINNAWGTVCNNLFRVRDAQVACNQLIGFEREGATVINPRSFLAQGPIFLDELSCTESDSNLQECSRSIRGIGLTTCNHTEDVWVRCRDIDECATNNGNCEHYCKNIVGSFVCSCLSGYRLEADGLNCANIDECIEGSHNCDVNATCLDTDGGFYCTCNNGYTGSGTTGNCSDLVECNDVLANNCHDNATCVNTIGSFYCVCNDGYRGDGINCTDFDECSDNETNLCHVNATCRNTAGSYDCECDHGFQGSGFNCSNINECDVTSTLCDLNSSTCVDTIGSYECRCNIGYLHNGSRCNDIDECSQSNGYCNQTCVNTIGSYFCECNDGYELVNESSCLDIDECLNQSLCVTNASCTNTLGSYVCSCDPGFIGNGNLNCSNKNECDLAEDNCDINALCEDLIGSFKCTCYFGYDGNGTHCSCGNGQVRFMNGSEPSVGNVGRVEICYENRYGTVCDDLWDEQAARVVCNGSVGVPLKGIDSIYGSGNGSIILDNVVCNGIEDNLLLCAHNELFDTNCDHTEDAAVVCGETCLSGSVRLINDGASQQSTADFIKDQIARGRVEFCMNDMFGTVCDDLWDNMDASVVCKQLGFSPYGAIAVTRRFFEEDDLDTIISNVQCTGLENELIECPSLAVSSCSVQQSDAGVVCQDITTENANCSTGAIRLVNGANILEGRVEICINNAWGTICDSTFSEDESNVICNQIGPNNGSVAFRGAYFGEGTGPIFLERYDCSGEDTNFLDCAVRPIIGIHNCDHSMDAGVRCIDVDECQFNNGGCEQICIDEIPLFQCRCKEGYTLDSNGRNCSDINECEGSPCHRNATCENIDGSFVCSCAGHFVGDGFICTRSCVNGFQLLTHDGTECVCNDGDVRLVGGSVMTEGGIEVCINNSYGGICDDFWDKQDATVACIQFGFTNDSQPIFGLNVSSGSIFLDNVQCRGNETSLLDCERNAIIGDHNCNLLTDGAGVRCGASCRDGDIRICLGTDRNCVVSPSEQFLIDDRLSVGRVEVCSGGRFGTICDDFWTNQGASVVCWQLGFSRYGAIALNDAQFAEENHPISINSLNCFGNEESIMSCSINEDNSGSCGRFEDAGVVCQEQESTIRANCSTGSVRLANMTIVNDTAEGRVEVCINQAWGTVCDNKFDEDDAGTVCVVAGGYLRNASMVVPTQVHGADSPIFLEQLDCDATDSDLLQCNRFSAKGIHSCTHAQDVSVRCTDIDECTVGRPCDQICTNDIGSFQCSCNDGYKLQSDGVNCSDIDECALEIDNCALNSMCTNTVGSFNCTCNTGYRGNGTTCINIDECAEQMDNCHEESNATCEDLDGSFECSCRNGFNGNGTFCADIDECLNDTTCHVNAFCTNTYGSYICSCISGYTGDGFNCTDIDECNLETNDCDLINGNCTNFEGGYNCSCNPGYRGDGTNCSNINECLENTHNCDGHASCSDNPGSFSCECNSGFIGDGIVCEDFDECRNSTSNNCSQYADCNNLIGSFSCSCHGGFTGDGTYCDDIDECTLDEDNCDKDAKCVNEIGSFRCECNTGFSGNGTIGNCYCLNGDVLLMNGTEPSINQREGRVEVCYENVYSAICDDLWDLNDAKVICRQLNITGNDHFPIRQAGDRYGRGSGQILLDNIICKGNEASLLDCDHAPLREHNCASDHSEDAGVICGVMCDSGYVRLVNDSSEVTLIKDTLSSGRVEICINNTFHTICDNGWGDADASVLCAELGFSRYGAIGLPGGLFSTNSLTRPSPGLADVRCSGSENKLVECISSKDIGNPRCETASAVCQAQNTSFESCEDGAMRLEGNNDLEGRLEICINNAWGTVCREGFSSDEATVVCRSLGFLSISGNIIGNSETISDGFDKGSGPIFLDELRCGGSEETLLNCQSGRSRGLVQCTHAFDVGVRCPDTDECSTGPCGENTVCNNTIGSFVCNCQNGYEKNESTCININECKINNGGCEDVCTDTPGSFQCSCVNRAGYKLGPDNLTCIDIDECEEMTNNCSSDDLEICVNQNGTFQCDCQMGYNRSNDQTCENIDECTKYYGICGNNTICNDTEGSFNCTCIVGYEQLDGLTCTDINECNLTNDCDVDAICENTAGSYRCICREGYTGNGTNGTCEDINECLDLNNNPCDVNSFCLNSDGSFDCQCSPGYVGSGFVCNCTEGDARLVNDINMNLTTFASVNVENELEVCWRFLNNSEMNCTSRWSDLIEGRVEICQNNVFGTVCDDRWDNLEARVICRQLRSTSNDTLPVKQALFGEGTGDIVLHNLDCSGLENNLMECPVNMRQTGGCDHSEDAGVRCGAVCEDYSARIINMDPLYDHFVDDELAIGRIELCLSGVWRPVCEDVWTEADASVACHQLGFSRAGAIAGGQSFQVGTSNIMLIPDRFNCSGSEDHLQDCPFSSPTSSLRETCKDYLKNAYVACQGIEVSVEDCQRGDVRLQSGSNVREGRVEVCINKAWGTVCSEQFSDKDASVVCAQMSFERNGSMFVGNAGQNISRQEGTGPIFLSTLGCNATDDNAIINCSRTNSIGLTECTHSQDVFVHCEAFCELNKEFTSHGTYTWPRTSAELYAISNCQYGGAVLELPGQMARRQCNPRGNWNESDLSECATFSNSTLRNITMLQLVEDNLSTVTEGLYNATSQANDTQDQSESNLNIISRNFKRISDNCSIQHPECSLSFGELSDLVNTLDSLQSWRPEVLLTESAETITSVMENIVSDYAESNKIPSGQLNFTSTIISDSQNVTFTGFKKNVTELKQRGASYSVKRFSNLEVSIRDYSDVYNVTEITDDDYSVSIMLPPEAFSTSGENSNIVFSMFESSELFPLINKSIESFAVASTIASATIFGGEERISANITIVLKLHSNLFQAPTCVFWDKSAAGGRGNWSAQGCQNVTEDDRSRETIICRCNHLSTFGVLVNTDPVNCPLGFLPNPSVTKCIPQKPDVDIIDEDNDLRVFNKIEEDRYMVEEGRMFEVLCVSTGQYKGRVTWEKMDDTSGNYTEIPEVNYQRNTNVSENFTQINEENSGQLYAYRLDPNTIYLGTRNVRELGASIGIQRIASGVYRCVARNGNENDTKSLTVAVESPDLVELNSTEYIRFSSSSFLNIEEQLKLSSSDLVLGVFETSLLQAIGTDIQDQQIVRCGTVPSRPVDMDNNWNRVACNVTNHPLSEDLYMRLMSEGFKEDFISYLPLDSLFQEGINISREGFCDFDQLDTDHGPYNWTEAKVEDSRSLECVYGLLDEDRPGMAERSCEANLVWGDYNGAACATFDTHRLRLLGKENVTAEAAEQLVGDLVMVVSDLEDEAEQSEDNLDIIANVFEDIDNLVESGELNVTEEFTENTVTLLSDISEWPAEVVAERSSGIVSSLETITSSLTQQDNFTSLFIVEDQIIVVAENIDELKIKEEGLEFTPLDVSNSTEYNETSNITIIQPMIQVPRNVLVQDEETSYILNYYSTPNLFQVVVPPNVNASDFNRTADTEVIGFTIPNYNITNATDPIRISFQSLRAREGKPYSFPTCVSWDFDAIKIGEKTRGNWTTKGCKLTSFEEENGTFVCECNHLTNFAVLVNTNARPPEVVGKLLRIVTIIGSVLSIVGLSITIFTMIFFRKLRQRDASKFHAQLCFAILLMLLVFVIGIDRTGNTYVCTGISATIQYFTLASVFWMGAEAILMFKKLVIVFGSTTNTFIITVSLLAWGVPLIFPIVGLFTLFTGNNYLIFENEYCFISDNRIRYGIFLAPLFSMVLFNLVIFVMVIRVLVKHSKRKIKNAKEDKNIKKVLSGTFKTLISIISVMIMFGLSWIFGALSVDKAAIVFQWLFVIFSTSQGFLLFIFFCVIGKEAREEWKKLLTCYRYSEPKKGVAIPSTYSAGTGMKHSRPSTYESSLTSRGNASRTIRRSVGMTEKSESFDSVTAPLDVEEMKLPINDVMDPIKEEMNGHIELKPLDSQLPPQILFRLKRPCYDLIVEQEETVLSSSPKLSVTNSSDQNSLHNPETDHETDPEIDPENNPPEIDPEIDLESNVEIDPESNVEIDPESNPEIDLEIDSNSEITKL